MKVAVFYATRHGQTRRIAEHVAAELRTRNVLVDVVDVAQAKEPVSLEEYSGVIVVASVHAGSFEREMVAFASKHRGELARLPSAFLAVSLTEMTAENAALTEEQRSEAAVQVRDQIAPFLAKADWRPDRVTPVAGALLFTKYNVLVKLVMKAIAKHGGLSVDAARDHELTDWQALDRFVSAYLENLLAATRARRVEGGASLTPLPFPRPELDTAPLTSTATGPRAQTAPPERDPQRRARSHESSAGFPSPWREKK